jgi:hypothetical protein
MNILVLGGAEYIITMPLNNYWKLNQKKKEAS